MTETFEYLKTLKDKVLAVLSDTEDARNYDKVLCIEIFKRFYGCGDFITFDKFFEVPNFESIRRVRQLIQEHGQYLPTIQSIRDKRKKQAGEWRGAVKKLPGELFNVKFEPKFIGQWEQS